MLNILPEFQKYYSYFRKRTKHKNEQINEYTLHFSYKKLYFKINENPFKTNGKKKNKFCQWLCLSYKWETFLWCYSGKCNKKMNVFKIERFFLFYLAFFSNCILRKSKKSMNVSNYKHKKSQHIQRIFFLFLKVMKNKIKSIVSYYFNGIMFNL